MLNSMLSLSVSLSLCLYLSLFFSPLFSTTLYLFLLLYIWRHWKEKHLSICFLVCEGGKSIQIELMAKLILL